MKKTLQALFVPVFAFSTLSAQNIIPKPQHYEPAKGFFATNKPYSVEASSTEAGAMAHQAGLPEVKKGKTIRTLLYTHSPQDLPREGYRLEISPDTIRISASSVEGFRYAATTLRALKDGKGRLACCRINDAPALEWRGAMIDVSRHFFPISFLKKQVDILARYKMNRLHIHLTDAAGWRMEIKQYPRLTRLAAWRSHASWKEWWDGDRLYLEEGTPGAYGGYYTQEELRDLVRYAESKGITLVPEIEMPAHSEEILTAYPEYSCTHEPYKQADFCPGNEATYAFLENILREVVDIFPSKDIHIGGDEAGKMSWPDCPLCQKRCKEEGYSGTNELQGYLIRRMARVMQEKYDRRIIAWDEVLADSLAEGTTVMVWRDTSCVRDALHRGHEVILSPGHACYLDAYQDCPSDGPEAAGAYRPLSVVYDYAPLAGFSPEERKGIRGVQGNLWTEYIPTTSDAERMLYPRLLAISEIGWTGGEEKDFTDFHRRAVQEVRTLRAEGVQAFDLDKEKGDRPERQKPVRHKARGAKVTYHIPYNETYASAGDVSLTDGKRGGWDFGKNSAWQGFIRGKRMDVVIDMEKVQPIKRVAVNFLQSSGPEIYLPAQFIISISEDGVSYKELTRRTQTVERIPLPSVETWDWKGKSQARYIRIQASSGNLGGWIFADEVEVY